MPLNLKKLTRREMLAEMAAAGLLLKISSFAAPTLLSAAEMPVLTPPAKALAAGLTGYRPSSDDEALLDELQNAFIQFFWEQASPTTGLVKDRSRADGSDTRDVASVAATGFGLTALCIADQRGYIPSDKLRERVLVTLRYLRDMYTQHGFYYHFININNGQRTIKSEVSSIDTALLLAGVLTCRAHFADDEIHTVATQIVDRVDWPWMLDGEKTLSHGWRPEGGFIKWHWDSYSELMVMYLLGIGSATHALPPDCWDAWFRPTFEYEDLKYVGSFAPIFVHQYSHAWFDFRGKQDRYTDYFANSVIATEAHRLFCIDLGTQFKDYSDDLWGITSSDSVRGYVQWGGPPKMGPIDGTVVPGAVAGSLPFEPEHTMKVLWNMRQRFDQHGWRRYGFVDSFNPRTGWYDQDVIAINVGISLLMAENLRTGFVWDTFMKNDDARRAMDIVGFKSNEQTQSRLVRPNGW
jgi:hypothetical protein